MSWAGPASHGHFEADLHCILRREIQSPLLFVVRQTKVGSGNYYCRNYYGKCESAEPGGPRILTRVRLRESGGRKPRVPCYPISPPTAVLHRGPGCSMIARLGGTSPVAPRVSGVAARLLSREPNLTAAELRCCAVEVTHHDECRPVEQRQVVRRGKAGCSHRLR